VGCTSTAGTDLLVSGPPTLASLVRFRMPS